MVTETASVTVERRIAAPPEKLFDAWLDPDQAGQWLFRTPDGSLARCEIDARVGGRFRIDERRGEEIAEHHGEYVELDRPRRLAFDFWTSFSDERTRVTVAIEPDGDGSLLTLTHEGVWDDWQDKTRQGWTMILDGLASALGDSHW
ncbi:MAG TPA: SRPBCC domain-containing protein [Allosphingosinicella sp.]|nr:SRPBCC domain-containing protein [Allosphingosinicella sp.]